MGATVETAGYWLPSEFFDDSVMDKTEPAEFCFPTEFPYDLQISPGEEVLPKGRVMSTSPQSTLAHMWSFSGGGSSPNGPTPPPSPVSDAVGDLIFRAAGQVTKLKLNDVVTPRPAAKSSGLMGPNHYPSVYQNFHLEEQTVSRQEQGGGMWCGGPRPWPVQHNPARFGRPSPSAVSVGGSGSAVKRVCAGTGVFLPRRYDNNSRNNDCINNAYSSSGYQSSAAALIPQRNDGFAPSRPIHFNPGFVTEYDLLMARRNALLLQHRQSLLLEGSSRVGRRVCLPREWTY